jgi:hypothetical protein
MAKCTTQLASAHHILFFLKALKYQLYFFHMISTRVLGHLENMGNNTV